MERYPLVGVADTDSQLSSQEGEAFAVINVSPQQPFAVEACQQNNLVELHS